MADHLGGTRSPLVCGTMTQTCAALLEIIDQIALRALGSKVAVRNAVEIWGADGL